MKSNHHISCKKNNAEYAVQVFHTLSDFTLYIPDMSKFPPTPVALPPSSRTGSFRQQIPGLAACPPRWRGWWTNLTNSTPRVNPPTLYTVFKAQHRPPIWKKLLILYFRLNIFRKLPFPTSLRFQFRWSVWKTNTIRLRGKTDAGPTMTYIGWWP